MLRLEVGKTYVDGRDHKILIGRDDGGPDGSGPMRGRDESGWPWWYERDGRSSVDKQHPELTLIREHTEESPAEVPAPQAQPVDKWGRKIIVTKAAPQPMTVAEAMAEHLLPDPNAAMLARDTYRPHQSEEVPLKPVSRAPKLSGVHIASPDLTPMGHQVAPHWAKDHS